MSTLKRVLHTPMQTDGTWWLPGTPERTVDGTLAYSGESISLKLRGGLGQSIGNDPHNEGMGRFERFDTVLGRTDDGEEVTLLRTFSTSRTTNLSGTVLKSESSAQYIVFGTHIVSLSDLVLTSLSVGLTQLDGFMAPNLLDLRQDGRGEEFRSCTVVYKQPEPVSFAASDACATVGFHAELSTKLTRMSVELNAGVYATIRSDSEQHLWWYLAKVEQLGKLLTLLTDERVVPTWCRIHINDRGGPFRLLCPTDLTTDSHTEIMQLFYLAHVAQDFAAILDKWFCACETLASAIGLFHDAQRRDHSSQEGRFLMLAQAVEAFCRATERSSQRISLAARITSLLESFSQETTRCVCKSPTEFVTGIVDTRNYFTHYANDLRQNALRGKDLYWACEKLAMLLRIAILRHIGIDEKTIRERVLQHHRLMQYVHLYRDTLECVQGRS